MKVKSLGMIEYPQISIESFNGSRNEFVIRIEGSGKAIKIKSCVHGATTIVERAREVVGKQRNYALEQWNKYKRLKASTGYVSPDGSD